MTHLRDLWLSAKQSFEARSVTQAETESRISAEFLAAMHKEFSMANKVTLCFLQWQRISTLLSLVG
jgi:hypothetical protein